MLNITKKIIVDGTEYEGYSVKEAVLDLVEPICSIVVHYYDEDDNKVYVKKHRFGIKREDIIDVEDLINKVHKIHND